MDPKGRLSSEIHFLVPLMRKILTKTKDSHIHDKILDDVLAELVDEPEFKSSIEEKRFF